MEDNIRVAKRDWKPEELLEELKLELQFDSNDAASATARLLRETALPAAQSIAHLALYAGNERVRFQSAQFVVDRTLNMAFDHDLKLQQAQIALVGQVMHGVIRALGLKFGFDPDSPEVKQVAYEKILELASSTTEGNT